MFAKRPRRSVSFCCATASGSKEPGMSVIHYKFKNTKKYETIQFEGQVLSVLELKRSIVAQKKLAQAGGDFDLLLRNSQTGEGRAAGTDFTPQCSARLFRLP